MSCSQWTPHWVQHESLFWFFFFIQHGGICLLLKQGCDLRIVYQTAFEEITESQNIFCCKPHFKINVVQKMPLVLFFAFCGKGEESKTPRECSISLCRVVRCKAYVVLFWGWSPTCCSCPNEPTLWDLPFFYQVDLFPPHTHTTYRSDILAHLHCTATGHKYNPTQKQWRAYCKRGNSTANQSGPQNTQCLSEWNKSLSHFPAITVAAFRRK